MSDEQIQPIGAIRLQPLVSLGVGTSTAGGRDKDRERLKRVLLDDLKQRRQNRLAVESGKRETQAAERVGAEYSGQIASEERRGNQRRQAQFIDDERTSKRPEMKGRDNPATLLRPELSNIIKANREKLALIGNRAKQKHRAGQDVSESIRRTPQMRFGYRVTIEDGYGPAEMPDNDLA